MSQTTSWNCVSIIGIIRYEGLDAAYGGSQSLALFDLGGLLGLSPKQKDGMTWRMVPDTPKSLTLSKI